MKSEEAGAYVNAWAGISGTAPAFTAVAWRGPGWPGARFDLSRTWFAFPNGIGRHRDHVATVNATEGIAREGKGSPSPRSSPGQARMGGPDGPAFTGAGLASKERD